MAGRMCGGASEVRDAGASEQELIDKVKHLVESKTNMKFSQFSAKKVSTQVVAGTNYFVKVHVGGDNYAHLRIFVPLPCNGTTPELHGVEHPKTKDCKLAYFGPN